MDYLDDDREVSSRDIYHRLGSLEGKLDSAIMQMATHKKDIDNCYERIRNLEMNMNKFIGIGLVACIMIPVTVNYIQNQNLSHTSSIAILS